MASFKKYAYDAKLVLPLDREGVFNHEGFSPKVIQDEMVKIEPDPKVLEQDVVTIVYFSAVRGAKPEKAMEKMSEAGKQKLKSLTKKYKISSATPKKPTDITVARVASSVPHLAAKMIVETHNARVVGECPDEAMRPLCSPSGAGLIPSSDKYDYLFDNWLKWAKSFNKIIKGGKPLDEDKVRFYGEIARNSNYMSEDEKVAHLRDLGII